MAETANPVARALHLRPGEGRTLLALGGFMLLNTAATTILSATKNGLFLSVYPGRYIPHVVIGAALLTAVVAVVFSGVIAGTARRSLAVRLTVVLVATVGASRWAFDLNPRMALGVYLAMSAVQVLVLTHAWDFVGDLLTGRQAKRLAPLIGLGASLGALLGGAAVPAAALSIGTDNLLLVGGALLGLSLPVLWTVPEPVASSDDEGAPGHGTVRTFVLRAGRGFSSVGKEPLLRLLAFAIIGLTLTGTLIELQFKLALQGSFERDRITAVMGIMSGVVGVGTLLAQLAASRWLFPKLGVSFAAALQGGMLALAAGGAALFGGVFVLAAAQAVDDILQFSVQKPVEQVSLLPFAGPMKSSVVATLTGVVRPLAKAMAGGLAILLMARQHVVPFLTTAAAVAAFLVLLRHRKLYMAALMRALSRHTVDFTGATDVPLVVDRAALTVIDHALGDEDPTVVVFALSLLEQLPAEEAVTRALRMLDHTTPDVRAAAAGALESLDLANDQRPVAPLLERIAHETDSEPLAALLRTAGEWSAADPATFVAFLEESNTAVRREALVALGRSGWPEAEAHLMRLLSSEDSSDRTVAAGAVGDLRRADLMDRLATLVEDDTARPAALGALAALGANSIPVLVELLARRDLPLPSRRSVVTALASVDHVEAQNALLDLVDEPALGPAALTSLQRMRRDGRMDPVDPVRLRDGLTEEVRGGLRYALVARRLAKQVGEDERASFIAGELEGLAKRAFFRIVRILSLSHSPTRLETIRAALASRESTGLSNALELLEGTLSLDEARIVVPFAEVYSENFPEHRVAGLLSDREEVGTSPLESLLGEPDWWARALALHGLDRDDEISIPGRDPGYKEKPKMIPLIERVMILKGSQLFRYFPGSDLAGIASLAEVVQLDGDEIVFRQGESGDAFYMVVRGGIRITRGSHDLALLGPREGFGEMAILDQETRSATATAAEPTTLLKIDRDSFDRLIEQNPVVARGIYRVLNRRLRNTLAQVAAG